MPVCAPQCGIEVPQELSFAYSSRYRNSTEEKQGMHTFTATELANKTGDVLAVAAQEPVCFMRHGNSRFMLLSVQHFNMLFQRAGKRRSVHADDMPVNEAIDLVTCLEHSITHD